MKNEFKITFLNCEAYLIKIHELINIKLIPIEVHTIIIIFEPGIFQGSQKLAS